MTARIKIPVVVAQIKHEPGPSVGETHRVVMTAVRGLKVAVHQAYNKLDSHGSFANSDLEDNHSRENLEAFLIDLGEDLAEIEEDVKSLRLAELRLRGALRRTKKPVTKTRRSRGKIVDQAKA